MQTRGILRPGELGRAFRLERRPPPADLAHVVDDHWIVSWDLRGREPYRSEVLAHPAVHLVFEPHGAAVFGVHRHRYERTLSERGWAVGTKFLPSGFAGFSEHPAYRLTDRVLPLADALGADGAALEREAADAADLDALLACVHRLLRSRLPMPRDPRGELVTAVVAEMRAAPPDARVDALAAANGVSTRTLQRLFRRYVGVGPKWVLQRYRLHEAIEQLEDRRGTDWSRFALDLGYTDQAHFTTDFRAVVGRTPSAYEAEASNAGAAEGREGGRPRHQASEAPG